jgi:hypothetical protein
MELGISHEEAGELAESLARRFCPTAADAGVSLSDLQSKLAVASSSEDVSELIMWARRMLEPTQASLFVRLPRLPPGQALGSFLAQSTFQARMLQIVPEMTQDQLATLTLLAHKNASGDINVETFVNAFCGQAGSRSGNHISGAPAESSSLNNDVSVLSDWGTTEFEPATTDNWTTDNWETCDG